jgi:hypothetical protein
VTPRLGDVVAVEWLDAWCDQDETTEGDWRDEKRPTTYGVLRRLGDVVTVVGEPFADGQNRATTHIPRAIVQRIRVLERPA